MKLVAPVAALSCVLTLAACGSGSDDDGVSVIAAAYPFAFVAERVAGDHAEVRSLTSPGVEPHDVELTGRQVADLSRADVVIHLREFQPAVDAGVREADPENVVDLADVVDLLEDDHGHEEEGHDDAHDEDDDHGHDHGGIDPHVWLDPRNMIAIADAVADALVKADPANEAAYRANAEALNEELTDLDTAFAEGLATCERRTIVTNHAAFGYLAHRYDLTQVPIAGLDPSNEPTSAQLAAITRLVREDGITTIFSEELVSPKNATTIANETGATTATLDPVEGLGDATADEDYLSLMRANLDAIRKANDCR